VLKLKLSTSYNESAESMMSNNAPRKSNVRLLVVCSTGVYMALTLITISFLHCLIKQFNKQIAVVMCTW